MKVQARSGLRWSMSHGPSCLGSVAGFMIGSLVRAVAQLVLRGIEGGLDRRCVRWAVFLVLGEAAADQGLEAKVVCRRAER